VSSSHPAIAFVRAARPRHWLKNGFVLAPALFAGRMLDPDAMLRAGAVTGLFCLASSAVYLGNDVADRTADRADSVKRLRPVASGELSVAAALLGAAGLLLVALLAAGLLGREVLAALTAYIVVNLAYSMWLKKVAVLEAMLLASGFVLRLAAGALGIPARPAAGVWQAGARDRPPRCPHAAVSGSVSHRGCDVAGRGHAGSVRALHRGP
jgi:4-hydroxybenzoate polyprenyltransferase